MAVRTLVFCCTVCLFSSFRLHHKVKKLDGNLTVASGDSISRDSQADLKVESISEMPYKPGDVVSYHSESQNAWVPTVVSKVDATGVYVQIRPGPVALHKLRRAVQPQQVLQRAVHAVAAANRIQTVPVQQAAVAPATKLAWHFEAEPGDQAAGIVPCAAHLFKDLMIEKVSEWCCQIQDGMYWNPVIPKHCYTVLSLYDRRSPELKWWAILELFSSDEHGSEEEGDATIACAASQRTSFETSEAAAFSHVCHKKGFPVGHIQRHPQDPKNIFDLDGTHDFTVQYLRKHPHYDMLGYNCQWYSVSLLNEIAGTHFWRKQATSATLARTIPEETLEKLATSVAASRSDGNEHHEEEHDDSPQG